MAADTEQGPKNPAMEPRELPDNWTQTSVLKYLKFYARDKHRVHQRYLEGP